MRLDFLREMDSRHQATRIRDYALETARELLAESVKDEMDGWSQIGGKSYDKLDFKADLEPLRRESQRAYYRTPHGRGILRTLLKFTIGAGVVIDFSEKDPEKLKQILKWWKKFTRNIKWFSFLVEIVRRALRDGEVFLLKVRDRKKPLTFRFIDPEYISDDGIKKDPNDAEVTLSYEVLWGGDVSRKQTFDAKDIIHIKIDADRNMKRGRPTLEVQFPLLTKFAKWLDARMVLSYIRTSVALVREVQGSPMDLSRIRSQYQSNRSVGGETNKMKTLRPGSILSATAGSKWTMLSPNLDARDAATDGRNLQLAMAAGAGLPDVFVTGDYGESNFASSVVSQNPAIREFEMFQGLFKEPLEEIITEVLMDGIEKGVIETQKTTDDITGDVEYDVDLDFEIKYPPLIKRDLSQDTNAYKVMNEAGVLSKRSWGLMVGLNPDTEKKQIEEEDEENPTKQPEPSPELTTDPTINHRKAIAPKSPAERRPRQNVKN